MGECTGGVHQGAPSQQCAEPILDVRPPGLSGAQRITLQTLHCYCLRQSLPLQKHRCKKSLRRTELQDDYIWVLIRCISISKCFKKSLSFFQDYHIGVGITSIEMNVGSVKETDRRSFDLITPYRIFRFVKFLST